MVTSATSLDNELAIRTN